MKPKSIMNEQAAIFVDESYPNSVIPTYRNEMWRKVEFYGDVNILGGIFSDSLKTYGGNCFVRDSIYCRDFINVSTSEDNLTWLNSAVTAGNSIMINSNNIGQARVIGDLYANSIILSNTIVYGNIVCENAKLNSCVILGNVKCVNRLDLKNSIIGTFETGLFAIDRNCGLLTFFGVCNKLMKQESIIKIFIPDNRLNDVQWNCIEISESDIIEKNIMDTDGNYKKYVYVTTINKIFDLSYYGSGLLHQIEELQKLLFNSEKDIKSQSILFDNFEQNYKKIINHNFEIPFYNPKAKIYN